ncbi:MAG: hypothetical protein ABEK10_01190 [Candidatus Nanosalina sp.]
MLISDFRVRSALKIIVVGAIAGTSGFLFTPFVMFGPMTYFMAAFGGVLISLPVLLHFLKVPTEPFNFSEYWDARGLGGTFLDFAMTVLLAMAPGVVVLYGLLNMEMISPVPVASSTAVGVFTGYSAFLYRNRGFYSEDKVDIEL